MMSTNKFRITSGSKSPAKFAGSDAQKARAVYPGR